MLLNEILENSARQRPQKIALICQKNRINYSEINQAANALAENLIASGFQPQDRAIIYLENSPESIISLFGILKAGGVFVIINPKVKCRKLVYIVEDCQARVLITDQLHAREIAAAFSKLPSLLRLVVTGSELDPVVNRSPSIPEALPFEKILHRGFSGDVQSRIIDIDLASLIYTSGSSGNPKGVMLTHLNMISAANSIIQYLGNTPDDIIIDTLPLAFDYGLYQVLMAFKFGGTVVLEKTFTFPEQVIDLVIKEKVTGWPMVPTIAALLCRLKNLGQRDFSNLRYITSTGQSLPEKHIARLQSIFPKVKIFSMYGLTECKRVSYLSPEELSRRPGSVGKAMPNTEVFIVDELGKEIQEPGMPGELVVRGANVMQGYWNLPEATTQALRPGRYPLEKVLYTGDLFKKDTEGYLYFLGRKDDIVKTAGHMVSPREVENVLCEMRGVVEAAVIGVQDEILGQAIKAFVHVSDESPIGEKEVLGFCKQYLEDYALPKYITFCGALPKNDSGKVQKKDLV
jgi:long-chain acyl-CoA synthetase